MSSCAGQDRIRGPTGVRSQCSGTTNVIDHHAIPLSYLFGRELPSGEPGSIVPAGVFSSSLLVIVTVRPDRRVPFVFPWRLLACACPCPEWESSQHFPSVASSSRVDAFDLPLSRLEPLGCAFDREASESSESNSEVSELESSLSVPESDEEDSSNALGLWYMQQTEYACIPVSVLRQRAAYHALHVCSLLLFFLPRPSLSTVPSVQTTRRPAAARLRPSSPEPLKTSRRPVPRPSLVEELPALPPRSSPPFSPAGVSSIVIVREPWLSRRLEGPRPRMRVAMIEIFVAPVRTLAGCPWSLCAAIAALRLARHRNLARWRCSEYSSTCDVDACLPRALGLLL